MFLEFEHGISSVFRFFAWKALDVEGIKFTGFLVEYEADVNRRVIVPLPVAEKSDIHGDIVLFGRLNNLLSCFAEMKTIKLFE